MAGAGVFGAWIAYTLRRAGHEVTLLDPYGVANARASSGGESRIIRCSYGADEIYTRMARRSLKIWTDFFAQIKRPELFQRTGVLWLAGPEDEHAKASRRVLREVNVEFEDLSPGEVRARYPQLNAAPEMGAVFEPKAGALMARQAVQAVVSEFVRLGGRYQQSAVLPSNGNKATTIYACGPWLGKLFPEIVGARLFVTRQEIFFFGIPAGDLRFQAPQLPIWLDFGAGRAMYGFPDLEGRGFKVAHDKHGPAMDPDTTERLVSPELVRNVRAYLTERFPALANAPVVDARVCQYENTSNGDFLIDQHPHDKSVWLVGGGSGHGFKHGPAVAEYVAHVLNGGEAERRFLLATKETTQKRVVV